MKKIVTYFPFLVLLLLFSCANNDDEGTMPPADLYNIDLGTFELLPESIAAYPYTDKSQVQFVDSIGNEILFDIQEPEDFLNGLSFVFKYDVYAIGDTVNYTYQSEKIRSLLRNDSLDLSINLSLAAQAYYNDPQPEFVADVMNVWISGTGNSASGFSALYLVLAERTWPEVINFNERFSTINLLNRDFTDVWHSIIFNSSSELYFNTEYGVVYFTDHDGKAWRFDQFIE